MLTKIACIPACLFHLSPVYMICYVVYGDELTGKNLEGSGEEEASTFLQSEELAEEEEERQAAEDDG